MTSYSFDEDQLTVDKLPRMTLLTMFRLGLFQMGLGMMSILTLGVLNRVMIKELAIPATIAAGVIAVHQFMAPARLWFGQMSDARPLAGYHRTGYVWMGSALLAIAALLSVQVMWQFGASWQATGWSSTTQAWMVAQGGMFALYGLALSSGSTPFAALLVDVSEEQERSKLVGIVWSMLMVGIVIGAILSSQLLPQTTEAVPEVAQAVESGLAVLKASIDRLFVIVPVLVFGLAVVATWGIEKKYSRFASRTMLSEREDQITLGAALRVLTASPQTGIFFGFLLLMTVSLFMQDAVLESYGGQVFGMSVSETTKLNAFYGMGTLIGISTSGFAIAPRLGKENTTRLGCFLVACCVLLLAGSGFVGNLQLFKSGVFLFGLASGVTTTGAISLMLDLTAAQTAGTFIGAWGLAQAIARGLSTLLGGVLLDWGSFLFTKGSAAAYSVVFTVQALGMLVAIGLLSWVNVKAFQQSAKAAISSVLQAELD